MRRNRGGYTIIEVMIVLAISGVLFTSAIVVFQGQQSKTILSQSLYDLASKIQSYTTEVSAGVYDGSSTYSCSASPGGTPSLNTTGVGNDGCLFLGKALQISQNSTTLYAYTVLGNRLDASSNPVTQLSQTTPEPAQDNLGNWVLGDTYALPTGEVFVSSRVKPLSGGAPSNAYLVGVYIDLTGATAVGGTTALTARGYSLPGTTASNSSAVKNCIEQQGICAASVNVRTWQLCVSQGSKIGSIDVIVTASGVTTSVNAEECV